jgi:hypothetical protein
MKHKHRGRNHRHIPRHYKSCKSSVVSHEHTLGGSPRLNKTRLSVRWFAANRFNPPTFWEQFGLTIEQLAFMFAVIDDVSRGLKEADE